MNTSLFLGVYQELLRAWPNRWLGFFIALVITAIVGLTVIVLPDQYQSKAKVYINSSVVLEPLLQGLAVSDDAENRVRLLRVLQSTLVSKENVERLVRTPGMGFDAATPAARGRAYGLIKSGVTVTEEEQNLFAIDYVDTDPVRARNVAQGLLSLFIERNVVDARNQLTSAREFLDRQIAEYQGKLRDIERQISAFQLTNVDALGSTSYQTRLAAARTTLREAQVAKKLAVDARDKIAQQINSADPSATPKLLAGDPTLPVVIDRLAALQAQLNTLLLQYTESHPDVIATRREIALLSEQYGLGESIGSAVAAPISAIPGQVSPASAVDSAAAAAMPTAAPATAQPAALVSPATQRVKTAAAAARMRLLQANFAIAEADRKIAAAQAELSIVNEMATSAPQAETALEQLNRDYAVVKENYEQLLRRRESARMRTAADANAGTEQFRIVVAPSVPELPAGPDRQTYMLLGSLLAIGLGAGLAYALGLLRGTFVSAAEAESALGLPVIARLTNRHGVLSRAGQSADTLMLLAGVVGLVVAAYVLAQATELLSPLRTEIYGLLEASLGKLF